MILAGACEARRMGRVSAGCGGAHVKGGGAGQLFGVPGTAVLGTAGVIILARRGEHTTRRVLSTNRLQNERPRSEFVVVWRP